MKKQASKRSAKKSAAKAGTPPQAPEQQPLRSPFFPEDRPATPKAQAQDLAWDAMDARSEKEHTSLLERALALDPECVDALVMKAARARTLKESLAMLEKAVDAGERALGEHVFTKEKGYFWGLMETRPYMRARAELASTLRDAGHTRKALGHYEALLELNPNDNQGLRYSLLGCYLACSEVTKAGELLKAYEGDSMPVFAWGRVLHRYLAKDLAGARRALKAARSGNPYVEQYLCGMAALPEILPEMYSLGSPEEAVITMLELGPAWAKQREALMWLLGHISPIGTPRKSSRKKGPSLQ